MPTIFVFRTTKTRLDSIVASPSTASLHFDRETRYYADLGFDGCVWFHRERLIELAFEAQRFWDLRRWKRAYDEQNKMISGWNILNAAADMYYNEVPVYLPTFSAKDYFRPIVSREIYSNNNILQNYGW